MDEDSSDNENDDEDGLLFIPLSTEDDKRRIRAVWVNSIIVKLYGKPIPYSLLVNIRLEIYGSRLTT